VKCNVDTAFEYGDFSVLECYVVYTVMYGATFRRTICFRLRSKRQKLPPKSHYKSTNWHDVTF